MTAKSGENNLYLQNCWKIKTIKALKIYLMIILIIS